MNAFAFDTHRIVDLSTLVTKSDLAVMEGRLQSNMSEAKADLLKWMVGAVGLQTVIIVGALIALARTLQV